MAFVGYALLDGADGRKYAVGVAEVRSMNNVDIRFKETKAGSWASFFAQTEYYREENGDYTGRINNFNAYGAMARYCRDEMRPHTRFLYFALASPDPTATELYGKPTLRMNVMYIQKQLTVGELARTMKEAAKAVKKERFDEVKDLVFDEPDF